MNRYLFKFLDVKLFFSLMLAVEIICATGCSTIASGNLTPMYSGTTNVTLLASSTANDQLFQMRLTINTLSLVNQNGQVVSLLNSSYPEFIHINGNPEPLATTSIPQGVYVKALIDSNEGGVSCMDLNTNGKLSYSSYGDNGVSLPISVLFPEPITITGNHATLLLNMMMSQSFTPLASGCAASSPGSSYSLTPDFQLTTYNPSGQPQSNMGNRLFGMEGIVSALQPSASSFTVHSVEGNSYGNSSPAGDPNAASGPTWTFATDSNTVFQGIASIAAIVANVAVDVDATIQPDGSLLATRVAVYDTNATNTSLWCGDIAEVTNTAYPSITGSSTGFYPSVSLSIGPVLSNAFTYASYAGAAFSITGQFQNLSELPFSAVFSSPIWWQGQLPRRRHAVRQTFRLLSFFSMG